MAEKGIVPIEIELTEGNVYTLWAPSWREGGAEWQAFLGKGDDLYFFDSEAELAAFLDSGADHDLTSHPRWNGFAAKPIDRVRPTERYRFSLVTLPASLAEKPAHKPVDDVARGFAVVRSLANVADLTKVQSIFSGHSILGMPARGAEHFVGNDGLNLWSSVGGVVLDKWADILDELDELVEKSKEATPAPDSDAVTSAKDAIAVAVKDAEDKAAAKKQEEEDAAKEAEAAAADADPYDSTVWAQSGIDPVKIVINGRVLYTLRCYLDGSPVFLGRFGEIRTFPQPKNLTRWVIENEEHDMANLSTWPDIVSAANGGDLDVVVHDDNVYTFSNLEKDIRKGPDAVDRDQLAQAYELLADAADWANDDSVNMVLAGNQELQWYLNYVLDPKGNSIEPSAPYTSQGDGWRKLEEELVARFSTKI